MKGNQGLDALAALCGGQSVAPASEQSKATSTTQQQGATSSSTTAATDINAMQPQQGQNGERQTPIAETQSPLQNINPQQWQQAIAAAAALQGGGINPAMAAQNFLLSGLQQQQQQQSALGDVGNAMQQLALHQYLQNQAKLSAQQAAQIGTAGKLGAGVQSDHQALMLALAGKPQQIQPKQGDPSLSDQQQSIASANTSSNSATTTTTGATISQTVMQPPLSSNPIPSSESQQSNPSVATIAPMPGGNKTLMVGDSSQNAPVGSNKKQQKRAANRRSAQLSRKRKKQFIEELKEENDELRRKEQILRSIPDLIVVFDSSGKLGFVSESVARFINISPEELEGTSFWNRLCEDSVRLLKAAFMDSLAARQPDSDTAPLGSGVWELRLLDRDSNFIVVTLTGIVHFSGEAPECVCCVRPRDQKPIRMLARPKSSGTAVVSTSSGSDDSGTAATTTSGDSLLRIPVHPDQSVINAKSQGDTDGPCLSETTIKAAVLNHDKPEGADKPSNVGQAVRISDGSSDSGSSS